MFTNKQIFTAPLAGITDKPFRQVVRSFSPDVSMVTEMISCHSLVERHRNCPRNFDKYDDEGRIGAQIFGSDSELMVEAAKILESQGAMWIDINMGCPVPKVATRAEAGAFLMRDHALAGKIMESVVRAVKIPVSVKTRLGWDSEHVDWDDMVRVAAESGVAFVALHGRTRAQGYCGNAVWPDVHKCKIPMIANGDIKSSADLKTVEKLGYTGAMIGRAMLGAPWIVEKITNPDFQIKNVGELVLRHLDYVIQYYGERVGVPMFRKHVAWYSAGMPNSSEFRLRVNTVTSGSELKSLISEFWGCVCNI